MERTRECVVAIFGWVRRVDARINDLFGPDEAPSVPWTSGLAIQAEHVTGQDGTDYRIQVIRRGVVPLMASLDLIVTPISFLVHHILRMVGRGYAVEVYRVWHKGEPVPYKRAGLYQVYQSFPTVQAAQEHATLVKSRLSA